MRWIRSRQKENESRSASSPPACLFFFFFSLSPPCDENGKSCETLCKELPCCLIKLQKKKKRDLYLGLLVKLKHNAVII